LLLNANYLGMGGGGGNCVAESSAPHWRVFWRFSLQKTSLKINVSAQKKYFGGNKWAGPSSVVDNFNEFHENLA
jgi:hypothetical protein